MSKTTNQNGGQYTWTFTIKVRPLWVAEGLNLTQERMEMALETAFPYMPLGELSVSVDAAPDHRQIRAEQGYNEPGFKPVEPEGSCYDENE